MSPSVHLPLSTAPTPEWLRKAEIHDPLPVPELLRDSVYYPCCARDGDPVRYLGGHFHSFIYVDYLESKEDVLSSLHSPRHRFRGYHPLGYREVSKREITPDGFRLLPLRSEDGDPRDTVWSENREHPFALWLLLERSPGFGRDHGPERLSILFIGGDGVATFQALYPQQKVSPAVVCIIQAGMNWTDFYDPEQIFGRCVLGNPAGPPRYLLCGGYGRHDPERGSCWPQYPNLMNTWFAAESQLSLWARI